MSLYILSLDIYPAVRVQVKYSSSHSDKFLPRTDFSRGRRGVRKRGRRGCGSSCEHLVSYSWVTCGTSAQFAWEGIQVHSIHGGKRRGPDLQFPPDGALLYSVTPPPPSTHPPHDSYIYLAFLVAPSAGYFTLQRGPRFFMFYTNRLLTLPRTCSPNSPWTAHGYFSEGMIKTTQS